MLTLFADLEPLRAPGQRAPSGPRTPSPPVTPWTVAGMRSRSVIASNQLIIRTDHYQAGCPKNGPQFPPPAPGLLGYGESYLVPGMPQFLFTIMDYVEA